MYPDPKNSSATFWQLARVMAEYSARAYTSPVITDLATNASALITLSDAGDIIVAFKGSSSARDFLEDVKFGLRNFGYSQAAQSPKVHRGFLEDFAAIEIAVVSQVKTYLSLNPAAKIFVTGHSLGGAEAILCAYELARLGLPLAGVFTFGQPRVGNKTFAEIYNSVRVHESAVNSRPQPQTLEDITFRIVNQNDIVPRVPGWLCGYRHCGQEIFLEPPYMGLASVDWNVNPSLWFKLLCDALGLYAAYRQRKDVLIREHFIAAYQERIGKICDEITPSTAQTLPAAKTVENALLPEESAMRGRRSANQQSAIP